NHQEAHKTAIAHETDTIVAGHASSMTPRWCGGCVCGRADYSLAGQSLVATGSCLMARTGHWLRCRFPGLLWAAWNPPTSMPPNAAGGNVNIEHANQSNWLPSFFTKNIATIRATRGRRVALNMPRNIPCSILAPLGRNPAIPPAAIPKTAQTLTE